MKNNLYFIVLISILMVNCSRVEYIPIQSENKTQIRDSIVFIIDTINVPLPTVEYVKILPEIDTSELESTVAYSKAYYDTTSNKIHHTLKNKPYIHVRIDTFFLTKTVEVFKEKPIIKEVEVKVKYVPDIYKYCLWFTIAVIVIWVLKLKKML